jgi:hypothetical protein
MARNRKILCAALVFLSVAAAAQTESPFEFKQFSATMVMSGMTAGREGAGEMKIYRSGDKMRTDMPGGRGYMIADFDQKTNYMVMNGTMCMQMSSAPGHENPFSQAKNATIERSPAGTDTVDGHPCKVENVTVTPQNGQPAKMKVWEAQDLKGFPVKVEMQSSKGPITVEYKDISLSEPDASLFTHPGNCRQMPNMPNMPNAPH